MVRSYRSKLKSRVIAFMMCLSVLLSITYMPVFSAAEEDVLSVEHTETDEISDVISDDGLCLDEADILPDVIDEMVIAEEDSMEEIDVSDNATEGETCSEDSEIVDVSPVDIESSDEQVTEVIGPDVTGVLYKILYEDWDPYHNEMTVSEFYELMELFQTGVLPLKQGFVKKNISMIPYGNTALIPRTMFLFNGVTEDATGADSLLVYPPSSSEEEDEIVSYPEGLDPNGAGYKRPPMSWSGVNVSADDKGQLVVAVIVKNENDDDPTIAGNVDQSLFPTYDDYYVSRVTAEGIEASILGVIEKNPGEYVYFYMSADDQSTQVSSTTLGNGQKFIVQYLPKEYAVSYKVELNGSDVTDIWVDKIFGSNRLKGTVNGKLAFAATGPYLYETELFLLKSDGSEISLTEDYGTSTTYPLGREITYKPTGSFDIVPDTGEGPSAVVWQDVFNLPELTGACTIIARLTKKPTPHFNAGTIIRESQGSGGIGGQSRGTNAIRTITVKERATGNTVTVPYDYEDEAFYRLGLDSKYTDYPNNANWPNIMNYSGLWYWTDAEPVNSDMYADENGTYSFSWTFQTNSGSGGFTMDSLAVNGVTVSVPTIYKYDFSNKTYVVNNARRYYSEAVLPDGAIVRVEFLSVFSGRNQRVYRVTVVGASSDVTVTAINLKTGNGSDEFVVGGLDGIYGGDNPSNYGIEGYCVNGLGWQFKNGGAALVLNQSESVTFTGDPSRGGANIRFKLRDGYSSPYFYFQAEGGAIVGSNSSVELNEEGDILSQNPVRELPTSGTLEAGYVYGPDEEGYYYIKLTGLENNKFANLTINARSVFYVVRYMPCEIPEYSYEDGSGNTVTIPPHMPVNMPTFSHSFMEGCDESFWGSTNNGVPGEQYDDFNGRYYDILLNSEFVVSSTAPTDPNGFYKFTGWMLLDGEGNLVEDAIFSGNTTVNINDIKAYVEINDLLGGNTIDIAVIRLMPKWEPLRHPFKYSVVLDWVDAQGVLHQEHFSDYWEDILTESPEDDNSLTVYVNPKAGPLLDWIAQHPTYTFWDAVNNISDTDENLETKIEEALDKAIPSLKSDSDAETYEKVLNALKNKTANGSRAEAFSRLGGYAFEVHEDGGCIVIWMYENKGGLMFHEEVEKEGFINNEEFYFTVDQVEVGAANAALNNTYKAYPEHAYNEDGSERPIADKDAWLVKFEDGRIVNIVKNDGSDFPEEPVTYFTVPHGEGIMLYVPDGSYTITQLGSKSGGKYKVAVEYDGDFTDDEQDGWEIPDDDDLWLRGSLKERAEVLDEDDIMQVSAKVKFDVGEANVVHTIIFYDRTSSLSVKKEIVSMFGDDLYDELFTFKVLVSLPEGDTPLYDEDSDQYYYIVHNYDKDGVYQESDNEVVYFTKYTEETTLEGDNIWVSNIKVQGGCHSTIVMQVLKDDINYYVEEIIPANPDYKLLDSQNTIGEISSGELETATFWNTDFEPGLTITESIVGPASYVGNTIFGFTVELMNNDGSYLSGSFTSEVMFVDADGTVRNDTVTFTNGIAVVSLGSGDSITFMSLPPESRYNVIQDKAYDKNGKEYFSWSSNGSGVIPNEDTTVIASFENTMQVPITLRKTVTGSAAELDREFDFTLTITDGRFGLPLSGDLGVDSSKVSVKKTSNGYILTFKMKHGDEISIDSLPYLTEYTIVEDNLDYLTKIYNNRTGSYSGVTANGVLDDETVIQYENSRDNGSFSVSKQVQDPDKSIPAGTGDSYEFSVKLTSDSGVVLNESDCTFTLYTGRTPQGTSGHTWTDNADGSVTVTFKLMHGQSFTIDGLPPHTEYAVVETDSGDYEASYSSESGEIQANTGTSVTVVNAPKDDSSTYDLTVSKTVGGNMGDKTDKFMFKIKLTDELGNFIEGTYSFTGNVSGGESIDFDENTIEFVDGEAKVLLGHEDNIVIKDLPKDILYTVTELDGEIYDTNVTTTKGRGGSKSEMAKEVTGQLDKDTALAYMNIRQAGIPTDATFGTTWLILVFVFGSFGIFLGLRKRSCK